jgi:hypothetical protein
MGAYDRWVSGVDTEQSGEGVREPLEPWLLG